MKISLNWLKDFVEFDPKLSVADIKWRLTEATAEIEQVIDLKKKFEHCVIGFVRQVEKHPDADKLQVAQVDIGSESVQIVCGGVNLKDQMLVAVALPGAMVRWHGEGELVEIKQVKIRGVESTGMICAAAEIGLEKLITHAEKEIVNLTSLKAKPGQLLSEALELNDIVFDIDNHAITHRPDLFSQEGFARECVALGIAKWRKRPTKSDLKKMVGKKKLPFTVRFADERIAKSYHGTIVENLDARPAPQQMRSRLFACGIRSINALVDITNYVMLETGAPMHAFDRATISGEEFQFRLSKRGEKMRTLDGKEQELFDDIMVVENDGRIVDLVGIMGGENSEITEKTHSVYFHQGVYDPVLIRKAMIGLGQRTDAGTIYEKGPHAQLSEHGMLRTLELTKDIFPKATFDFSLFVSSHRSPKSHSVSLPLQKVPDYLGVEIPAQRIVQILTDLGCTVKKAKTSLQVTPPDWRRQNLQIHQDLIEEIARIYGYSNIIPMPPSVQLATPHKNPQRHLNRTLQQLLIGMGFLEELNFSFLSKELMESMGPVDWDQVIEITNPVSEDFRWMRKDLLPSLLQNLSRNIVNDSDRNWRTFERGSVFAKNGQQVLEKSVITLLCTSKADAFADAKGIVETLLQELSWTAELKGSHHPYGIPRRVLQIDVQGRTVGHLYELHPLIKEAFKIEASTAVVDWDLNELSQLSLSKTVMKKINRNPKALLDVSVLVEKERPFQEVQAVIASIEPGLLSLCELRDLYESPSLGEDKKSLTFGLTYQHPERTLEDAEIQSILERVIKALEQSGGVVRR